MAKKLIPALGAQRDQQHQGALKLLIPFFFIWNDKIALILFTFLPMLFYSIFGMNPHYADIALARGNFSAQVMLHMALYGAVFSIASGAGRIGNEIASGWMRQIALSPVGLGKYNTARILTLVITGVATTALLYVYGLSVRAKLASVAIAQSALVMIIGMLIGALFGLVVGLLVRSDAAAGIIGGASSVIAFASGIFVPLEEMGSLFQKIGPWTPLWGVGKLLRDAVAGWPDPILLPLVNIAATLTILAGLAMLLARRSTYR